MVAEMNWSEETSGTAMCNPDDVDEKIPVTVEVCLKANSVLSLEQAKQAVQRFLEGRSIWYKDGPLEFSEAEDCIFTAHLHSIRICDTDPSVYRVCGPLLFWQFTPTIHIYQLDEDGAADDDEGEDGVPTYKEWQLPAREFDNLWESLVYDTSIKHRLLRYATTALLFADRGVDSQLVSWNRVVLLHGPPGTGKTSLCKALSQKLSIRFGNRYRIGQLIEVNAHSLFSKWFSESGKLVSKLFAKITELVEEQDSLVFILIDEVESLTSARKAAVNGSEPTDAIRAVNALLTQLDALKRFPNVMVLTTSNITEAIDLAFVDRADIKAYIGPPSLHARYDIMRSSLLELARAGIIGAHGCTQPGQLLLEFPELADKGLLPPPTSTSTTPIKLANITNTAAASVHLSNHHLDGSSGSHAACKAEAMMHWAGLPDGMASMALRQDGSASGGDGAAAVVACSQALVMVSQTCEGFSGRALRKIPFLAHAMAGTLPLPCSCMQFIRAMHTAALKERQDRESIASG